MRVVLVFPFRDDAAGTRAEAFEKTRTLVTRMYDWCSVITVDSGHLPFNRAASRNLGVQEALKRGADCVVLCDADSIPEAGPLREAINTSQDGKFHYPFDKVWALAPKITPKVGFKTLTQLSSRCISQSGPSQGGIWVCKPETWVAVGGQEPRLRGWGCEDRAFLAVTQTFLGDPVFHPGVLLCLHHGRVAAESWMPKDVELLLRYEAAIHQPNIIQEIIDERSDSAGPLEGSTKVGSPVVRVVS